MTETIVRMPPITLPTATPLKGTLLDAATVTDGIGFLDTVGLFESYNCIAVDSKAVWPCPAQTLTPPVQAAAGTATTGGTLPAGTYRAVVTAVNSRGETVASNEVSQVTTGATSTITWNWAAVSGATSYRVYMTTANGASGSATFLNSSLGTNLTATTQANLPGPSGPPASNTAVVPVTKTFNAPGWVDGIRFAVYAGVICKGFDQTGNQESKLRAAFEARESVGVERALMQTRFTTPAATDITPAGGAVDPTVGVALLESDAACKYAGVPTLHVPRGIATLLSRNGVVQMSGNTLTTVLGSKIAAGGGYGCPNNGPTGAAPAAGEQWLYASGEVLVARSEVISVGDVNRDTNEQVALVERAYVAAVDCYTAAVRVKVQ